MTQNIFTDYHQLLYPVAFKMLGNASDAEDLVQETMLKWLSMEKSGIANVRGYLVKTLINKCLNFIRDRKKETNTEVDIAPELIAEYLPSYIENSHSLSLGVLAMLEKLSSMERAVFLLKEVFGFSHREIAAMLDITEAYCRQILARARRHMQNDRQRFEVNPEHHLQLYRTFIEVCKGENLSELLEILKEDIEVETSRPAAVLTGHLQVGEYLLRQHRLGFHYRMVWLRGFPALVAYLFNKPVRIIQLEGNGEEITEIRIQELGKEETELSATPLQVSLPGYN